MDRNCFVNQISLSDILLGDQGHAIQEKGINVSRSANDYHVIHILSGRMTVTMNDKVYTACPGDLFLLTPGCSFIFNAEEKSEYLYQHFSILRKGKAQIIGDLVDCRLPPEQKSIVKLFRKYFIDRAKDDKTAQIALKSILKVILLEFIILNDEIFHALGSNHGNQYNNKLYSVISYIQSNPGKPHNITSLADMAGYNPSYFSRYFKKYTGASATEYVDHVKMNTAKKYLSDQQMSVKDVASRLGFSDPYVFSRKFKKHFGFSPSEYGKNDNIQKTGSIS